jgi:hypothetical protein
MKRILTLTTAVAVAVGAPAAALAHGTHNHGQHRAKVLRAKLAPVREDVAAYTAMGGKAQMTANKRNAKVSLHLKGMVPGATYTWAVATGTCADGPVPLTGWKYRKLVARNSGNANSKAWSKKGQFVFDGTKSYSVVVYQTGTTDEVLLCGDLKAKTKKAKKHGKKPAKTHKVHAKS